MATLKALAETAESMRRAARDAGHSIRWVDPANYHVTLKFLGSTRPEVVEAIRDRLESRLAPVSGCEFTTTGMGAFPSADKARVIWAGVDDPSGGLTSLARIVEDELVELGFPRETRAFHPHVTMGRVRRVDDVSAIVHPVSERIFRKTVADAVVLFESVMKSSGSEYVERARFSLSGRVASGKRQTEPLKPWPRDGLGSEAGEPVTESTPTKAGEEPVVQEELLNEERDT
jgi:2'-5' RNA ligase